MKKTFLAALAIGAGFAANAALPDGSVLFESFEAWDGTTKDWIPDGWTVEMRGENQDRASSWTPSVAQQYFPLPTDGKFYYGVSYSKTPQDEWLISPAVEIAENMVLTFDAFIDPCSFFNLGEGKVDWDKYEFIGEREVVQTLQVWAKPEGGEWSQIHDFSNDYMTTSLEDLSAGLVYDKLLKYSVGLNDVAGKKSQIALRYVGADGNTILIDAIKVGYPNLENISFIEPYSALYYGYMRTMPPAYFPTPIAVYPVYEPLTWTNTSWEDAEYNWNHEDPKNKGTFLDVKAEDGITLTYEPDYSTLRTLQNNFFKPHTLTATATGASATSFTAPYTVLQAGGKAEITFDDGSYDEYSLMAYDLNTKGLTQIVQEDTESHVTGIPIFGHDNRGNVDNYWLKYSEPEGQEEGDYSHLIGIGNLFMPTEAPLVVNGMTLFAYGLIDPDAELTAKIYATNAAGSKEVETFTTIATATCKGSDILTEYPDYNGTLTIPFDFDKPIVVKYTDEHPYFFFMVEGFRSDKVKYFAPLQSSEPLDLNFAYGMYDMNIGSGNASIKTIKVRDINYRYDINSLNGYADPHAAFAIGLNAEYPWLTCEAETVEFAGETEVALGSYYDGSKLTVTAPEGITAEVSGRYDKCIVKLTNTTSQTVEGKVTVAGPGVEVDFDIKGEVASISEITSAADAATQIFDLQGRKVVNPRGGLYIVNGKKVMR
ncbi:MAG: choice-of-anchor J domain-containing protein [Prevotella sp.]|nr:choice-of-anchor J domain-containing protein [Bacteroides sp.]MCM1444776.1 choice-of-anchor J domain-containing protein [Prevotella sp.]